MSQQGPRPKTKAGLGIRPPAGALPQRIFARINDD
jgi:hypothetical protein